MRHFTFTNHNQLMNCQEPRDSSIGTLCQIFNRYHPWQPQPHQLLCLRHETGRMKTWSPLTAPNAPASAAWWRRERWCPHKGCQAVVSMWDKSFFTKSKLSFQTILKPAYTKDKVNTCDHSHSRSHRVCRSQLLNISPSNLDTFKCKVLCATSSWREQWVDCF